MLNLLQISLHQLTSDMALWCYVIIVLYQPSEIEMLFFLQLLDYQFQCLITVIDVFVHMNKKTAVTRTAPSQG